MDSWTKTYFPESCFEWHWDKKGGSTTVVFNNRDRNVIFSPGFSVGTGAVRGTEPLRAGYHHYWEIEMSTEVYGTDMMIGVGTDKTDLRKHSHDFVSLIGIDEHSWGLSYSGKKKHAGQSHQYSKPFGQNSIVGVHLDLWTGTLEFYIDRKPLGLAFDGLRDKVLYPIISSTAAWSGMNLLFCRSYKPTLQLQAMLSLSQNLLSSCEEENPSIFKVLSLPPGMKSWMKTNYWWIVSCRDRERKREEELNNRANCDKKCRKQNRLARQRKSGTDTDQDEEYDEGESDAEEEDNVGLMLLAGLENPNAGISQPPTTSRRRRIQRASQQCTAAQSGESGESDGTTNCMRLLAATSSRTHFLGRVSPIFVGMPEGGFSVLSGAVSTNSTAGSSSSYSRPVTRSRSVPAQPSAAVGANSQSTVSISKVAIVRQPASSEEDDDSAGSDTQSARREPKRLKLRSSIESNGNEDEDAKETNGDDDKEKKESSP